MYLNWNQCIKNRTFLYEQTWSYFVIICLLVFSNIIINCYIYQIWEEFSRSIKVNRLHKKFCFPSSYAVILIARFLSKLFAVFISICIYYSYFDRTGFPKFASYTSYKYMDISQNNNDRVLIVVLLLTVFS